MKLVYIAGPFRNKTEHGIYLNIHAASEMALKVWKAGAVAVCPHKNTESFGGELPDEIWLKGDLELLRRCDALLTLYGYWKSEGAMGEVEFAKKNGIPVFHTLTHLKHFLRLEAKKENGVKHSR